jgi:hypothetical protein
MLDREVFKHDGQNADVVDGVGLHQRTKRTLSKDILAFLRRLVVGLGALATYRVLALAGGIFGQFTTSFDVPALGLVVSALTVSHGSSLLL